jgi:hypothetical protein
VVAGLQGDDRSRVGREWTGRGESLGFGVRFAFALVVSLADDPVLGIEQHAADRRVRARRAEAGGGQCDGASHGGDFGG